MNYRHAFHAGNFADVHKHVVLLALMQRMLAKSAPLLCLDTHAGRGCYDLKGHEASRAGEWHSGIERIQTANGTSELVRHYAQLTHGDWQDRSYPGSPLLLMRMLRPDDRAVFVEQQEREAEDLRRNLGRTRNVSIICGDGYTALKAQLPPKEKRCLVLIDPPYEDAREFEQLRAALLTALQRWPQAVIAVWYPIKAGLAVERWLHAMRESGLRKLLACELVVRPRDITVGLNGSGMLIANPPWQVEKAIEEAQVELLMLLREAPHAGEQIVEWIVPE